jgi:hypothetical protein
MSESLSICLGQYSDYEPQDMSESVHLCRTEFSLQIWCTSPSLVQSQGENTRLDVGAHLLPYSKVRTRHRVVMFLVEPHMAFCRK